MGDLGIRAAVGFAAVLFATAGTAFATSPADNAAVVQAPELVAIKEVPASRVAIVEHSGPYWTIGATLRRVFEMRQASSEPVELFARFASSPLASRSAALRAEVGYVVPSEAVTPEGFLTAEHDAELVATLSFEAGDVPRAQHFSQLRQWIVRNGYRAVGPVTEVYSFPSGDDSSVPRVELRMAIRPANEPRMETGSRAAGATVSIDVAEPTVLAPLPDSPAVAGVEANSGALAAALNGAESQMPTMLLAVAVGVEPASGSHLEPTTEEPARVAVSTAVELMNVQPVSTPESTHAEPDPVDLPNGNPEECGRLAGEFLRDFQELSPNTRTWLEAVSLRIDAIARALRATDVPPNEIVKCSSEISVQLARFKSKVVTEAPFPSNLVNPRMADQKATLRELEGLMGRLAVKRVEVGPAADELAALFERIGSILDAERLSSAQAGAVPP